MKKFLSLALALVMSLSLLTVASAAEYKDLTDKSEITYSEAVAVLNKLGIISGYEDGSFKPETALNRAQAAKIMCGLLLTQSTADKLTVSSAPFKDVAADYWAAAYISYCKNAGILDGYSDGTFHPTETLTGYQFGKMLLTALGYDSATEGFIGRGWTLNVARVANTIGLFSGNSEFSGAAEVTREEACQYALNMLKATEVTYDGLSIDVSTGDSQVTINNTKAYKVDNTGSSDGNIIINGYRNGADGYMQFAEEHFPALKMVANAGNDDFGRPANAWTYKNVTVGTYGEQADKVYTASMVKSTDSDSTKASKIGLKGYKLPANGIVPVMNGKTAGVSAVTTIAGIADLTKNGRVVEVFLSDTTADEVKAIVVIDTYLAQIDRISTSAKSVKLTAKAAGGNFTLNVGEDDTCYADLSKMAKDDYLLVVPVYSTDGTSVSLDSYAIPETVTGNLTKLASDNSSLTVGGNSYDVAYTATEIGNLTSSSLSTTQESKLFLDSYGYAIFIKDVTAASTYMSYLKTTTSIVDGTIVYMVQGIGTDGSKVVVNIGDIDRLGQVAKGTVLKYAPATSANVKNYSAEYDVTAVASSAANNAPYFVSDNSGIPAGSAKLGNVYFASGVTFVYIDDDTNTATVKDGVQKLDSGVAYKALITYNTTAGAYEVKAVFVGEAAVETGAEVAYVAEITDNTKVGTKDGYVYTIYFDGVETKNCVSTDAIAADTFVTYSVTDGVYTLKAYTKDTAATSVEVAATVNSSTAFGGTRYMALDVIPTSGTNYVGAEDLNVANAEVIDISGDGYSIGSISELKDVAATKTVTISLVYNGSSSSSSYLTVSYIFVTNVATPVAG